MGVKKPSLTLLCGCSISVGTTHLFMCKVKWVSFFSFAALLPLPEVILLQNGSLHDLAFGVLILDPASQHLLHQLALGFPQHSYPKVTSTTLCGLLLPVFDRGCKNQQTTNSHSPGIMHHLRAIFLDLSWHNLSSLGNLVQCFTVL